jgi:hypothetical protein
MKKPEILQHHPAETKAGALGAGAILVVSILEAMNVEVTGAWLKVITGVVALAPAVFTWLFRSGGIRGVARRILNGTDEVGPPVPA